MRCIRSSSAALSPASTRSDRCAFSDARLSNRFLTLAVFVGLAVSPVARAAVPEAGVFVPGSRLGGVSIGMPLAQVTALWGSSYGRCRRCATTTLYFNRRAFRPEGAGVELRGGRVSAVFTLWSPGAWSTSKGLHVGEPALRVSATYGVRQRTECDGYVALVLAADGFTSVVYIVDGEVWGFALIDAAATICR
jgi:hypothetical protein